MLLTAVVATVVIVAWMLNRAPGGGDPAPSRTSDTQLAEHALVGLGAGVTVREITQATPFSLVALTGEDGLSLIRDLRRLDEESGRATPACG